MEDKFRINLAAMMRLGCRLDFGFSQHISKNGIGTATAAPDHVVPQLEAVTIE